MIDSNNVIDEEGLVSCSTRKSLNDQCEEDENENKCHNQIIKISVGLLLASFVTYVIVDAASGENKLPGMVKDFLDWVEDNPTEGMFAIVGGFIVATVCFIPGTVLITMGTGFICCKLFGLYAGIIIGVIVVFTGASIGAILAFLLGRYLLRDWVMRLMTKFPIFEAIDNSFESNGFKIMTLLRLSPIVPFNALNYIGGATSIPFKQNAYALLFILPGTTMSVIMGSTADSLMNSFKVDETSTLAIIVLVLGIVACILTLTFISYYSKKELKKLIDNQQMINGEERTGDPDDITIQNLESANE